MRDNDFEEILPSPFPSPASLGSASTETTTDETGFILPKLSFFGGVLRCSVLLDVEPFRGMASEYEILLFFTVWG